MNSAYLRSQKHKKPLLTDGKMHGKTFPPQICFDSVSLPLDLVARLSTHKTPHTKPNPTKQYQQQLCWLLSRVVLFGFRLSITSARIECNPNCGWTWRDGERIGTTVCALWSRKLFLEHLTYARTKKRMQYPLQESSARNESASGRKSELERQT